MTAEPRYFRIRAKRLGGHVHTTWWSARRRDGSYAGLGSLVVDEHDWAVLAPVLAASPLITIVSDPVPEDDPASGPVCGVDWVAIDRAVGRLGADPPHPGEILTDWLADSSTTQAELARRMGVTDPYLAAIRNGSKNIGPDAAVNLEAVTGIRAEVWLHLQAAWSLARLRPKTDLCHR